jgi:hypothetical protein
MTLAAADLQKQIYTVLSANPALQTVLQGQKIYDHPPTNVSHPFVVLGRIASYDWSTGTEAGQEHFFSVEVWSSKTGMLEAQNVMGTVADILETSPLSPNEHRLVNLGLDYSEARYDPAARSVRGVLRYRAVTEPL